MTMPAITNRFITELPDDEPVIIMSRTFNGPLALVWKLWTSPEHVARWWGVAERSEVVEYDVRTGGKWRILEQSEHGPIAFYGTYLVVEPQTFIRNTFVVEGMFDEDDRFYEEHRFTEQDGKVHYRSVSKLMNFEQRQSVIDSGMENGANLSMAKFDELLEDMQAKA